MVASGAPNGLTRRPTPIGFSATRESSASAAVGRSPSASIAADAAPMNLLRFIEFPFIAERVGSNFPLHKYIPHGALIRASPKLLHASPDLVTFFTRREVFTGSAFGPRCLTPVLSIIASLAL